MMGLRLTNAGWCTQSIKHMREIQPSPMSVMRWLDPEADSQALRRVQAAANRIHALPHYLLVLGGTLTRRGAMSGPTSRTCPIWISDGRTKAVHNELLRTAALRETTDPSLLGDPSS